MARLQFEVDDEELKTIKNLMGATRTKTFSAFLGEALSLYVWSLKERHSGRIIAALNELNGQYKQAVVPSLERVAPPPEHAQTVYPEPIRAPDLVHDAAWNAARSQVLAKGDDRYKSEQERMRRLGILDEKGRPKSKDWPPDMTKGSKTDVGT